MNDTEHGYFLSGDIGDKAEEKYVSLLLAVSSGNMLQGFRGFLSYLLYGPASVSLYAKALEQISSQKKDDTDFLKEEFRHYIHVASLDSPTRWARNANMIWCHDPGLEGVHTGVLRLRHSDMIERLNKLIMQEALIDTSQKSSYCALAMLSAMSMSMDRDNSYFISLFHFLAFILKCVQVCEDAEKKANERQTDALKTLSADLISLLEDLYPIKSSRKPAWLLTNTPFIAHNTKRVSLTVVYNKKRRGKAPDIQIEKREALRCLRGNKEVAKMAGMIADWYIKKVKKETGRNNLSVHSMGDLWADMYYGIKGICHNCKPNQSLIREKNNAEESVKPTMLDNSHLKTFHSVLKFYATSVCVSREEEKKTLLDHYLWCLYKFPLLDYLLEACDHFAEGTSLIRQRKISVGKKKSPTATKKGNKEAVNEEENSKENDSQVSENNKIKKDDSLKHPNAE